MIDQLTVMARAARALEQAGIPYIISSLVTSVIYSVVRTQQMPTSYWRGVSFRVGAGASGV